MTVQVELPKELEQRLLQQVKAGRYASLQDAILGKLSQSEDVDPLTISGVDAQILRETYPAQEKTAADAGWDDSLLDEYQDYDRHRRETA